jgi:AcrR family transcriptional regulator
VFVPRAGLSAAAVVDTAVGVLDEQGPAGLTLAAVAARAGVAAPSLYKHVPSLAELRRLVGQRVLDELIDRFSAAVMGRSGADAVAALMRAHRAYALEYPARYAAMPVDPLHDPDLARAGNKLLDVFSAVLRPYGLTGTAAIHAVRCMRAMTHGFATIEAGGGFALSADVDDSYDQLITLFVRSLPTPDPETTS